MNDIQSSGITFSPGIATRDASRAAKHKDARTWTDKMFQNFNKESGEVEAINVDTIDCAENSTLGSVNLGNDNISVLVDFAANVDTTAILKGEDVIVLGGNRAGRGGQGRLYVPMNQFENFLQHCAALYESVQAELPALRESIRAERGGAQEAPEEVGDMDEDGFIE